MLPPNRNRFSKNQLTQPQLLAFLCLMRYEDWTFREAVLWLGERCESRQALGVSSVPVFTTFDRLLQRLGAQAIDGAVGGAVRRLQGWRRRDGFSGAAP